jgi:hypothetical protein
MQKKRSKNMLARFVKPTNRVEYSSWLGVKEELVMGMKNLPGEQNCNLCSRAAETYWALSHHAIYNLCPTI